jgi:hypothetical protein
MKFAVLYTANSHNPRIFMLKHLYSLCLLLSISSAQAHDTYSTKQTLSITHSSIPYNQPYPTTYEDYAFWSKAAAYRLASYLTDPVCKAREYAVRSQTLEDLPPSTLVKNYVELISSYVKKMQLVDERWIDVDYVSQFAEKCFLIGGAAVFSTLTPITALPAMALRFVASKLGGESFIHYTGLLQEKELTENNFTHMQWNICGIKAGYDIEEGAQMPIRDDLLPFNENRIVRIAKKILEENPDVLCLNEVFDINDASYSALVLH